MNREQADAAVDGASDAAGTGGGSGTGSSGTEPPLSYTSGTRIKARATTTTVSTADGAQYKNTYFAGWFDSMRNEACAPGVAADGKTRCLPAATALWGTYFADAACTVPVLILGQSCNAPAPAPTYISQPQPVTCPPSTLGPKLFSPGTTYTAYYSKSGATCSGPNTIAGTTIYGLGTEIAPTQFAEMTVATTTQ